MALIPRRLLLILALLAAVTLAALWPRLSAPRALGGQTVIDGAFDHALAAGQSVGQSFVARQSGLAGVELLVDPATAPREGTLVITLREGEREGPPLDTGRFSLASLLPDGRLRIPLDAPFFTSGRRLVVEARLDGAAGETLVLRGAGPLTYRDGTRYVAGEPQDAQLRFMPIYRPWGLLFDLLVLVGRTLWHVGRYFLLFGLPGAALLAWFAPGLLREPRAGLMLAPVAGLAALPLLYVGADLVGLPLSPAVFTMLLGLSALLVATRWRAIRALPAPPAPTLASDALLVALLLLLALSRFAAIEGLEGPSWGDAIQHAVLSQRLDEADGLFESWEPYAPYRTQTTHFTFSAATAAGLAFLGSGDAARETLLMGQWLNLLAVVALYPLAVRAGGGAWAGIGALLVAGLLSPMPGNYVNWSRYAQLAGQVVIPLAMLLLVELTAPERRRLGLAALLGLTVAGMALAYYRMPIYFVWFGLAWALLYALPRWGRDGRAWRLGLLHGALAVAVAVLALLPWGLRIRNSTLTAGATAAMGAEPVAASVLGDYRIWLEITTYVPAPLLALAALVLVVALGRRARWPLLVALWALFLAGSRATGLLNFPLANYLQSFAILIMLYLPLGLLAGWLLAEIVPRVRGQAAQRALTLALVGAALWGTYTQATMARGDFVMLTRPDRLAFEAARAMLPIDARVLVNGYAIYDDSSFVGADAGWWLPLFTGRENTLPPQYAVLNEQPSEPGYTGQMLDLILALRDADLSDPTALDPLCAAGVTHLYSGQRQGLVGLAVDQLLPVEALERNPALHLVHRVDQARLFELAPERCE